MGPDQLISSIEDRQYILDLQRYASIYVAHKDRLFPLMEQAVGEPLPDLSHKEAIELYTDLLSHPQFADQVDELVYEYHNAIDPVTAVAEGIGKIADAIGGIVGRSQQKKLLEQQADLQEEAFFQELVLNKQKDHDTGKILIVTGISAAAVGLVIYFIVRKK